MFSGLYYLPTGAVVRRTDNTTHGIFTLTRIELLRCMAHNPQLLYTKNEYLHGGARQLASIMANLCTNDILGTVSNAEIASWEVNLSELENVISQPERDAEYAVFRVTNPLVLSGSIGSITDKIGCSYIFQEAAKHKSHAFALRYIKE